MRCTNCGSDKIDSWIDTSENNLIQYCCTACHSVWARPRSRSSELVERDWGNYEVLAQGDGWLTKVLRFGPSCVLRRQRHLERAENWLCVDGYGTLCIQAHWLGEVVKPIQTSDQQHIPREIWHTFAAGPHGCTIIETWLGLDLREDDIERRTDDE